MISYTVYLKAGAEDSRIGTRKQVLSYLNRNRHLIKSIGYNDNVITVEQFKKELKYV